MAFFMMKQWFYGVLVWLSCVSLVYGSGIDASKLLPPEQAFIPQVQVSAEGINVQFRIAEGYYLYQSKIAATAAPNVALADAVFSPAEEKEDEFFGKQAVYHRAAQAVWAYRSAPTQTYQLTVSYQGCAEVGVCYPPSETTFKIEGNGVYQSDNVPAAKDRFLSPAASPTGNAPDSSRFKLSWDTLNANLLAFFLAGLGLSFTACMYPLIPIVSSIVVGDKHASKGRAFALTMVYTQGLALTYTLVGVVAGLTGALLTIWLQQAWVVLAAAGVMVVLALAMFGVFSIQLPHQMQSFFQQQSSRLSGGRLASVFGMGMLSALIVGPCVAPPLAFALGYIGQTGDAVLGGLALYALAIGTGVPLVVIGTFGGHVLPKAGAWMDGVKYAFGLILLAVAVYLATPFLPYGWVVALYGGILALPMLLLLAKWRVLQGLNKAMATALASVLLLCGVGFVWQSVQGETTAAHRFLSVLPANHSPVSQHKYASVAELNAAMQAAWQADPHTPILLDFYADWCVSCKEMVAYTLNQAEVAQALPMHRFFTVDVTANTAEHQALLKEYGLFGPPGIFVLKADGKRSEALLGFVQPAVFIAWYRQQ